MKKYCTVQIKDKVVDGVLIGVFQYSNTVGPSLMVGGPPGGTIAYPIAVVRIGDELKEVRLSSITLSYREADF